MKKSRCILFCLLWLTIPFCAIAQNPLKDSLKLRLSNYAQVDTQYIEDLYQLAYLYNKDGTDTMFLFANKLIRLSDSIDHPAGVAKGNRTLCSWYRDKLDFEKGVPCCKKAIAMGDSLGLQLFTAKSLSTLATFYEDKYPDSAIVLLQKSLDVFRETGNKHWQAIAWQSLGNLYRDMGNFERSIEAHDAALSFFRESESATKDGVPGELINIGTVYKVMGETSTDSSLKAQYFGKAAGHFEEAMKTFQTIEIPFGEMVAAINLGQVHMLKRNFLLALTAYERTLELNQRFKHPVVEMLARIGKVTILKRTGKLAESKQQALDLLNQSELPIEEESLKDLYAILHESSYELKQFDDAYDYLLKKVELEKKFEWNSEVKTQLADLTHEYEAKIQENQLALLAEDNRKASIYKFGLISIIIALVGLAIVGLFQAISRRKQQLQVHREKEARLQMEQRLAAEKLRSGELEKKQLEAAVRIKNQALSSQAIQLARKNQWLGQLHEKLKQEHSLQEIKQEIKAGLNQDRNWEEMRGLFEDLHPEFMSNLKRQFPELTKSDLRLAALYRMALSREEMLHFLAITPESFKMARYRLRKKVGLSGEEDLVRWIQGM